MKKQESEVKIDSNLVVIDLAKEAVPNLAYKNLPVAMVKDHVVRLSIMTEAYDWHFHPDSAETFLVMEGSLFIDLEDQIVELFPAQLFTVPKMLNIVRVPTAADL